MEEEVREKAWREGKSDFPLKKMRDKSGRR
jgi:hypothetical protein